MTKRHERTTQDNFLGIPGTEYFKTDVSDDKGNKGTGCDNDKSKSIDKAWTNYRENKGGR